MKTALVLGAGGFIGSHLVNRLKSEGYWVRGVDLKLPEYSDSQADDFVIRDLRDPQNVEGVMRLEVGEFHGYDLPLPYTYLPKEFTQTKPFDEVYQLAADMGGAGFVFTGEHDADIMHNSALINLNVCHYVDKKSKVFYSSSACMYPQEFQSSAPVNKTYGYSLSEDMAYPGNPDSEYGWEKLFSERLFLAYARNYGLNVRIARFHNIYGPEGTYKADEFGIDRSKAPAAMCRKAAMAALDYMEGGDRDFIPKLNIWGDGNQMRSFLYIDDCVDAVRLLVQSEFKEPINIGSEEMVSINQLAKLAIDLSGYEAEIEHDPNNKALGVRGRNSDNTLIRKELNWEPKYTLKQGMEKTFNWIREQIVK